LIDPRIAVENVSKRLKVSGTGKMATIVNIAYEDEIPERGVDVINKLLDTYNSFSIQAKNQLAENTLVFLDERLQRVKEDLDSIEARVQGYRSSQGVIDISEQGKIYLENVAESDRRAADVGMQLAVLDQVERYVRSGASSTGIVPTSLGIDDPVLADLLQRLNDLELRYANLRTTTGANNPIVNSVANEIAKIRPNILNIVTNQRARLRASQSNLQQTVNRSSAQLRSLPLKERELLNISRQQATLRSIYDFLLQKREEAALTNASVISDSRLIDRPEAAVRPSGTGKLIYLMIAGVLAFVFTIAYVLLKENFTRKILFRSAVEEKTGIPVIGEILYIRNTSDKVKSRVVKRQWNDIQAALGFFDKNLNNKKVLITSWQPAEGKTFVTTGLGTSIAATGKRVVLLDLNLYQPELSRKLEMKNQKGFTDFINGDVKAEDILYQTSWNDHLYLIPAGTISGNTIAMLLNPKWDELMSYLERQFDYILIDTPSVEQTTDARVLAKHTDKIVWVARHRKTPDTVLQTLKDGWDKNTGVLFNGVKGRGFLKRYYGHGFGYGYDSLTTDRH
jgi:capsular exopolysaccharide synthesis family protein